MREILIEKWSAPQERIHTIGGRVVEIWHNKSGQPHRLNNLPSKIYTTTARWKFESPNELCTICMEYHINGIMKKWIYM